MDKNSIRDRLSALKDKKGKTLFSSNTIDRLLQLPEQSLSDYLSYFDYVESIGKTDTIQTYRSKQLDFLEYISNMGYEVKNITQDVVDDYFKKYDGEESNDSYNNRVGYLKPFLNSYHWTILMSINSEKSPVVRKLQK